MTDYFALFIILEEFLLSIRKFSTDWNDNMKTLTVITTTYNRAYCLNQVYESLLRQTRDDFVWMIVDDGSTDDTSEIVQRWMKEKKIEIIYYFKQNGGMHSARNYAYERVETELNVIVDSDDWLTDNAVELIVDYWREHGNQEYYGMSSYNVDIKGEIIGSAFPQGVVAAKMMDLDGKYRIAGDKKLILRSDLSKKYPFPEFPGEKFFPASYKYYLLDQDYSLLLLNKAVGIVDYNQDSMTFDKYSQYRTCSKGFSYFRNEIIPILSNSKMRLSFAVHYVAESRFAKDKHFIRHAKKRGLVLLAYLPGTALYIYLKKTKRKY